MYKNKYLGTIFLQYVKLDHGLWDCIIRKLWIYVGWLLNRPLKRLIDQIVTCDQFFFSRNVSNFEGSIEQRSIYQRENYLYPNFGAWLSRAIRRIRLVMSINPKSMNTINEAIPFLNWYIVWFLHLKICFSQWHRGKTISRIITMYKHCIFYRHKNEQR